MTWACGKDGRAFGEEDNWITRSDVRSVRPRGRPGMGWLDSVKRVLGARGMSVEQGRVLVHDRSEWRAIVNA